MIIGSASDKSQISVLANAYFSNMVYAKADWDYKKFDVDEGLRMAAEKTSAALDATDPDLKDFANRGGKLIIYHGWNDPAISPLSTIDYYRKVKSKIGDSNADSFVRLFMVSGMQHCGAGPGPDSFGQVGWLSGSVPNDPQHNIYMSLEEWVEKGIAPNELIATKYEGEGLARHPTMTRPLCAFP